MRKFILALSICALLPMVTVAVARAGDDDEDIELTDYEDEELDDENTDDNVEIIEDDTEEERTVGKRMTCDEIKKEIDRLNALQEPSEEEAKQSLILKSDYRSRCAKKAGSRMMGPNRVKATRPAATEAVSNDGGSTTCETPDENGCCPGETYTDLGDKGFNCCKSDGITCFPPMGK